MRRVLIVSALGSLAALGYAAIRRLGSWLDAPLSPEIPDEPAESDQRESA